MSGPCVAYLIIYTETLGHRRLRWGSESPSGSTLRGVSDIRTPHQPAERGFLFLWKLKVLVYIILKSMFSLRNLRASVFLVHIKKLHKPKGEKERERGRERGREKNTRQKASERSFGRKREREQREQAVGQLESSRSISEPGLEDNVSRLSEECCADCFEHIGVTRQSNNFRASVSRYTHGETLNPTDLTDEFSDI